MSTANSEPEASTSPLELQISQLQDTFSTLWQKVRAPEPVVPSIVVIWGTEYKNQSLTEEPLKSAISSRICFTYRSGFQPISRAPDGPGPLSFLGSMLINSNPTSTISGFFDTNNFTTDVGWGCMIRTSQSLLANTLQTLVFGRDFCYVAQDAAGQHDEIISLFADNYESPFSLHNFIRASSESPLQVKPGEWFGPSAASLSIKRLCERYKPSSLPRVHVLISESCDLYDSEISTRFSRSSDPLLLLFPIRLGIEHVNSYYYPSLFQLLGSKHTVGIAGGKPCSSYYFFGYQDSELLYLDPHRLQSVSSEGATYHTSRCRSLPISALDPSMLVGILLENVDDYRSLQQSLAGTNKILHFHKEPKRRKSQTGEDYVRVSMPDYDAEIIDDFVNVSDHVCESESDDEIADIVDSSLDKYDVVERADAE